jgi:Mrp family chromosome partitioning ATPase
VECDFEQFQLARIFGAPASRGLADWLEGTAPLPLIRTASLDKLVVLCAGSSFVNPTRAMHRLVQSGLVDELRSRFRNVVLDLPPLFGVPYGTLAARLAERLVLVVRQGVTPIDEVERSIGVVGRERLAGLVLNSEVVKTPRWLRRLL